MKKITQEEIKKLTMPLHRGRIAKSQSLYRELKEMKVGETKFLSKEEWNEFKYKGRSFRQWWSMTRNQKRKTHKGSLVGIELEVVTYIEGWVIKKLK